jgi:hypothetical protein
VVSHPNRVPSAELHTTQETRAAPWLPLSDSGPRATSPTSSTGGPARVHRAGRTGASPVTAGASTGFCKAPIRLDRAQPGVQRSSPSTDLGIRERHADTASPNSWTLITTHPRFASTQMLNGRAWSSLATSAADQRRPPSDRPSTPVESTRLIRWANPGPRLCRPAPIAHAG